MKLRELLYEGTKEKVSLIAKKQGDKLWAAYVKDRTIPPLPFPGNDSTATRNELAVNQFLYPLLHFDTYDAETDSTGTRDLSQYLQWVVNQYIAGKFIWEDYYKVRENLYYFTRYKSLVMWHWSKDITQFDVQELRMAVDAMKEGTPEDLKSSRQLAADKIDAMKKTGALELYAKGDGLTVYIPNTEEAACYLGRGTKWCTAAATSYNAFKDYHDGSLYVVITDGGRKFQFHFATVQFMDERDEPIDVVALIHRYPMLRTWFKEEARSRLMDINLGDTFMNDDEERTAANVLGAFIDGEGTDGQHK